MVEKQPFDLQKAMRGLPIDKLRSFNTWLEGKLQQAEGAPPALESMPEKIVASGVGVSQDQGDRKTMEDTYAIKRGVFFEWDYFGVYDGFGGDQAAKYLAEQLHERILENLRYGTGSARVKIDNAYRSLDRVMDPHDSDYDKSLDSSQIGLTGSTAVTAVKLLTRLYIANVGDSLAVICSGGKAVRLSRDHKSSSDFDGLTMQDWLQTKINTGGESWRNYQELISKGRFPLDLSRAFGGFAFKPPVMVVPDVTERVVKPEDSFLILASDGLSKAMTDQEAVDLIQNEPNPQKASELLKNEALRKVRERGVAADNITVMVIRLSASGVKRETPAAHFIRPEINKHWLADLSSGATARYRETLREKGQTIRPVGSGIWLLADGIAYRLGGEENKIYTNLEQLGMLDRRVYVGNYTRQGGLVAFINEDGELFVGKATEENLQALQTAGYVENPYVNVPFSHGEEIIDEDIKRQFSSLF